MQDIDDRKSMAATPEGGRTAQPWLGPVRQERGPLVPPRSAARWLLVAILLAGVYFFQDFVVPLLAAVVIGLASWPVYEVLLMRFGRNRTIAASVAIVIILFFLVVPVAVAVVWMLEEITIWLHWAQETNQNGAPTPQWMSTLPVIGQWVDRMWVENIGKPGEIGHLMQIAGGANIGTIYRTVLAAGSGLFSFFLTLLFILIALFFVYRDGEKFARQLDRIGERILPARWERISRVAPLTVRSTVAGTTLIAIGEGIVLGTAYWIAGVPSPVTLGALTGLMALIPGGAPLSMTLVSAYLVASGSPYAGLGLFIWGSVELFVVDKTIRPRLVGGPISLPFLPTFFGLVGGVKTMGLLGLFIGPVLMAVLVTIWREWVREVEETPIE